MHYGIVKLYRPEQGYGFIQPDCPSEPDIFCHANELKASGIDTLVRGQRVSYDLSRGRDNRTRAIRLTVLQ